MRKYLALLLAAMIVPLAVASLAIADSSVAK